MVRNNTGSVLVQYVVSNYSCDADSDSADSIEELTNRGNKLKRRSRFVREGQLAPPTGPQVYRKVCAIRVIFETGPL
jgi:hypothetical protein